MAKKTGGQKGKDGKGSKSLNAEDFRLWKDFTRDILPLAEPDWDAFEQAAADVQEAPTAKGETITVAVQNIPAAKKYAAEYVQDPQLDARTEARLRRGQMPIEARLDLHGMTQAQAHENLNAFITGAASRGKRCVLVITGKGSSRSFDDEKTVGILRQKLPLWLSMAPLRGIVLKSYPAVQRDGGTGAWYLYLRRNRDY